jgi:xylulokinase
MPGLRILAIDFGTTRCKVALVTGDGDTPATSAVENHMFRERGGRYEQDAGEFRRNLARGVREVVRGRGRTVDMVAVTGQGSAPVCLDGQGKPTGRVISHLDRRADPQRERMSEGIGWMGYVNAKVFPNLLWMKENDQAQFRKVKLVLDIREYLGFLLTGRATYDPKGLTPEVTKKLLPSVGMEPEALGDPHDYAKPIGETGAGAAALGLAKGIPVLQTPGDTVCAAIGSGLSGKGTVADVAGTTEVVATTVASGDPIRVPQLYTLPHMMAGKAFLFTSPPLGLIFKWFTDAVYADVPQRRRYALVDAEAKAVEPADSNPVFIPFIRRVGYSYKIESQFLNLATSHSRGNLARSVMEGIAFAVRMALDRMKENGQEVAQVRLSGGGARSPVWNQVRADAFGVEAALTQTLETSCLGAAMVGAVSLGAYRDLDQAEGSMVRVTRVFRPRDDRAEAYRGIYAGFAEKVLAMEEAS